MFLLLFSSFHTPENVLGETGASPNPPNECLTVDRSTPAFPSAEGFGAFSQGGRGGKVYLVTTLEDYGPEDPVIEGSLRQAIEIEGPRIVVFRVGGLIPLQRSLRIHSPFITIAGQSAPGDGICLKDHPLVVSTHDVILRHIRSRVGETSKGEVDAISMYGAEHCIVDHCSTSWSIDEALSAYSNSLTIQWTIVSEPLNLSYHKKGAHGAGSILNGQFGGITLHHCIYAHCDFRSPRLQNKESTPGALFDVRNNVIYDWGGIAGYSAGEERMRVNYVGNYLKPGPSTPPSQRKQAFKPGAGGHTLMYVRENVLEGFKEADKDNWRMVWKAVSLRERIGTDRPFLAAPVQTETASEAYEQVLANAGAILPRRDPVDKRIVSNIEKGEGKIIDATADVGGWPVYENGPAPKDGDRDGMPDAWERARGLDPTDPGDAALDEDRDGYDNIEEFLNQTDPGRPEVHALAWRVHKQIIEKIELANQEALREIEREEAAKAKKLAARRPKEVAVSLEPREGGDFILRLPKAPPLIMERIPAGKFRMGSPEQEEGRGGDEVLHQVSLSQPFHMCATTVTSQQAFAVTGIKKDLSTPNRPVTLSWFDSNWFCEILSANTGRTFRLPTEAEWEYACRAGTATPFHTGNTIDSSQANFNGEAIYGGSKPGVYRGSCVDVGSLPPNAWGLHEMHGNMYEWTQDWYAPYPQEPQTDPMGPPSGHRRVVRGGSFGSRPETIRSACRYHYSPDVHFAFRVVME